MFKRLYHPRHFWWICCFVMIAALAVYYHGLGSLNNPAADAKQPAGSHETRLFLTVALPIFVVLCSVPLGLLALVDLLRSLRTIKSDPLSLNRGFQLFLIGLGAMVIYSFLDFGRSHGPDLHKAQSNLHATP